MRPPELKMDSADLRSGIPQACWPMGIRFYARLHGGNDAAIALHMAIGHAWSIESPTRISVAIEKNEATRRMGAARKNLDSCASGGHRSFCCGLCVSSGLQGRNARSFLSVGRVMKKTGRGFRHDNFHDGFAVTGAGHTAGFLICVTT